MSYLDFHRFIIAFILAALRLAAAMAILPPTSNSMITGVARRATTLAFASLLVPCVLEWMPEGNVHMGIVCVLALKEVVIGMLIGFFAAIPFWVVENVGNLIDNQRGATMGEVYSPLSGAQVSSTGIFLTQIVSTIFFVGGAFLVFLGSVYKSYEFLPLFGGALTFSPDTPVFMLDKLDELIETMFVIASPIVILMFLATIGLGFVNRTAPQLNVFFLSMPVKSALGIAMLIVYLQYILDILMYVDEGAIVTPLRRLLG